MYPPYFLAAASVRNDANPGFLAVILLYHRWFLQGIYGRLSLRAPCLPGEAFLYSVDLSEEEAKTGLAIVPMSFIGTKAEARQPISFGGLSF